MKPIKVEHKKGYAVVTFINGSALVVTYRSGVQFEKLIKGDN